MNSRRFTLNIAIIMATPSIVLAVTTSTIIKQAFPFKFLKHYNTDDGPLVTT